MFAVLSPSLWSGITQSKVITLTQIASDIHIMSIFICLLEPCGEELPFQLVSPSSMSKFVTGVFQEMPLVGSFLNNRLSHCRQLGWFR